MRRYLLRFAVVLFALVASGTAAAEPFDIDLNKGRLLRLSADATQVFVANPEIADIQLVSPKIVYVFGKTPGETNLFAVGEDDRVLVNAVVRVNQNLGGLNDALTNLLPGESISVQPVQGGLVLSGTVSSPMASADAESVARRYVGENGTVINRLNLIGSNQVQLRVRIAEISRNVTKTFGINWDALGTSGGFAFGLASGSFVGAAMEAINGSSSNPYNASFSYSSGSTDINALVDALADNGFIAVLAEPNLTALSGETASFLAGGEFPVPVAQDDGNLTIEFKEFGVKLDFTPTILDPGRINMRVRPEVSQLSSAGSIVSDSIRIPSLTTRRTETTIEVGSGQSFAIAGLLQNNINHGIDKFPILGDIPILGALFRSDEFKRDETELVIIVTPYLVRPVDANQITLPTDGFEPPSDWDRVGLGRHTAQPPIEYNPLPAGAPDTRVQDRPGLGPNNLSGGFSWE